MRQKFAKNPADSIRRKFSVDADRVRWLACVCRIHHFETIPGFFSETRRSPSASNAARNMREKPANTRRFAAGRPRLSVHLMSL